MALRPPTQQNERPRDGGAFVAKAAKELLLYKQAQDAAMHRRRLPIVQGPSSTETAYQVTLQKDFLNIVDSPLDGSAEVELTRDSDNGIRFYAPPFDSTIPTGVGEGILFYDGTEWEFVDIDLARRILTDSDDLTRKFRLLLKAWLLAGLPAPAGLESEYQPALEQN